MQTTYFSKHFCALNIKISHYAINLAQRKSCILQKKWPKVQSYRFTMQCFAQYSWWSHSFHFGIVQVASFSYWNSGISNTRAVPSREPETRKFLSADTPRDWMASECPLKVLTQSPERLSQIWIFPSTHPAATYLESPSHDKHVTPSCSQEGYEQYKDPRLDSPKHEALIRNKQVVTCIEDNFLCENKLQQTSLSHVQRGDECCRSQTMSLLSMPPVAAHGELTCKTSHGHHVCMN